VNPVRWLPWNYRDEAGTCNVATAVAEAAGHG